MDKTAFEAVASLDSSLAKTKTADLVQNINSALKEAGIELFVEKVIFAPLADAKCRCLEYGVVGYETVCTPQQNGGQNCVQRPIYGCKRADCT